MKVTFRKSFDKDAKQIKDKAVKQAIVKAILNVEDATRLTDIRGIKKMTGYKNSYRIRIGSYRIGVEIIDGVADFVRVLPRDQIYNYYP